VTAKRIITNIAINYLVMKNILIYSALVFAFLSCSVEEPWTDKQLMPPDELAKIINNPKAKQPLIYAIGFGGGIKNSIEMGAARDQVSVDKFRKELSKLQKDADIVIYCGCCPFERCPNVRPAFRLLNEMGFKNHKLLNLATNLKTDWIDKGYPQ
jgi:thiosulfate/3-mercaptopyruvate sulfurtransferase